MEETQTHQERSQLEGKRRGARLGEKKAGRQTSVRLFPWTSWSCSDDSQMDSLRDIFHTATSPVCMTAPMEPTSRECLHSSLALFPVTIKNYFHMFLWPVRSGLLTPVSALPGRPYRGRQLVDQMPRSSGPHWKVSTLLTGQMLDTWQDGHPDSPAEVLQTVYLPEGEK